MKNKKIFLSFIITFVCFTFFACSKNNSLVQTTKHTTDKNLQFTIGFSIDTLAIERWQRDLDIFINKVRELGGEVIVQNAGNNVEEQNRQLLYLLEKNCDAIVVLPKDASSLSESIQKIRAKNIPVISYDRLTLNSDINLYLTIDSEVVGEYMASELLRCTKGTNWYCIFGAEEDYNMTLIQMGLSRILRNTDVRINHTFFTEGWNYDLSYEEMIRIIREDKIPDAIVCGNDAIAASIIQALERYAPEANVAICGQDADIVACQYIVQGKQAFTIFKPIVQLAEYAAECAVHLAKGQEIETQGLKVRSINNGYGDITSVWLQPSCVDKYNMDKVIVESGFHSAASIYKN